MYYADNRTTGRYTYNTAIGYEALRGSSTAAAYNTGRWNTAIGYHALYSNSSGEKNSAFGMECLYSNTGGDRNTALGYKAGHSSTGDNNVFIGYLAGYNYSGDDALYIDNDNNTVPLIYGDFSSRRVSFGTITPAAKVHINSASGEDALRVQVDGATKLRVHANGSVSVGTSSEGPANGLESLGNIEPKSNKGADLGTSTKAWDDVYCDDLHNVSMSAFSGRSPAKEILNYAPKEKTALRADTGGAELDPRSMPPGLADDNSLLVGEIAGYNYKTNYEQQLEINELKKIVKKQKQQIDLLLKMLEKK
jgi:hypothetical protein